MTPHSAGHPASTCTDRLAAPPAAGRSGPAEPGAMRQARRRARRGRRRHSARCSRRGGSGPPQASAGPAPAWPTPDPVFSRHPRARDTVPCHRRTNGFTSATAVGASTSPDALSVLAAESIADSHPGRAQPNRGRPPTVQPTPEPTPRRARATAGPARTAERRNRETRAMCCTSSARCGARVLVARPVQAGRHLAGRVAQRRHGLRPSTPHDADA